MRNVIIGTAGHIDHGKTTLIKALTGRETDRLEEEKKRGITIELGFTYFDLPDGSRAGIIDVPGHEKFVHNMVAGVSGMDMVLLVIAADEGIMPQTREHLDILEQLGVENYILVLNKCDLVEPAWKEMIKKEILEELAGSRAFGAPFVEVSAVTGLGIQELIGVIQKTALSLPERDKDTIFRLPVDRVFSVSGFGTVVTGTVLSGELKKEEQLELFPKGGTCRVRSIQVHGKVCSGCCAGQRAAINLSNVKREEIHRGDVLATPGSMKKTMMLDVRLNMLPSSSRTIKNRTRVHLFTGTSQVLCRVVLLETDEVKPGETALAELRLEEEIAVRKGDRFIIRFYSPVETIGGGVVIEANPRKKRRFEQEGIQELMGREKGSLDQILELQVKRHGETGITLQELAQTAGISSEEAKEGIRILESQGKIRQYPMQKEIYLWHQGYEEELSSGIEEYLTLFHEKNPYKPGGNKSEIRMRFASGQKPAVFDRFLEYMEEEQKFARDREYLRLYGFQIEKDTRYQRVRRKMERVFLKAQFNLVRFSEITFTETDPEVIADVLAQEMAEGRIVKVSDNLYTMSGIMEKARNAIAEKLARDGVITIGEVRDILDTTRKSAKPILEYMDALHVTRKDGKESERVAY
jgi:selenocysteine-specific elongation factor